MDQIVGWRDYATTQPAGNFPNYSYNSSAALAYYNYATTSTSGFLAIGPSTYNGRTDQMFTSRQQLMQLSGSLGITPAQLQYMGNFSRSLEQPSFAPNSSRPRIVGAASTPPQNPDLYVGNNDAAGADDLINPAFLGVTVATSLYPQ